MHPGARLALPFFSGAPHATLSGAGCFSLGPEQGPAPFCCWPLGLKAAWDAGGGRAWRSQLPIAGAPAELGQDGSPPACALAREPGRGAGTGPSPAGGEGGEQGPLEPGRGGPGGRRFAPRLPIAGAAARRARAQARAPAREPGGRPAPDSCATGGGARSPAR